MKNINHILILLCLTFLGCESSKIESEPSTSKVRAIDKYENTTECLKGIVQYKPSPEFEYIKLNIYRNKKDSVFYNVTCDSDGLAYLRPLNDSIHILSVEDLGQFWVDKNWVYYKYTSSDGVQIIKLKGADRETFTSFGNTIYGKDKNHIFDSRHGIVEGADIETFEAIDIDRSTGVTVYGKDRYNYFF